MTTQAAAALYEAQHLYQMEGRAVAFYNPKDLNVEDLPVIYGFNNGGAVNWHYAALVAQDGTPLGSHMCSSEAYMPHDLGILEGCRPDRHEAFKKHYPEGYRMEFVSYGAVPSHTGLQAALKLSEATAED